MSEIPLIIHLVQNVFFKIVAGIAPDRFIRVSRFELFQKWKQTLLVDEFQWLATKQSKTYNMIRLTEFNDRIDLFLRKRLTCVEIPGILIKTTFTVVCAAGYEQRGSNSGSVCDITPFDIHIIHNYYFSHTKSMARIALYDMQTIQIEIINALS